MADPIIDDKGTGTGTVIDPVEHDNLKSVLGRQGKELGELRSKVAQYESERELEAAKAAESGKLQQYDTAISEVKTQIEAVTGKIAELDVTDPDFTKELTKLQKQQTELQGKAFELAHQKGKEETLGIASKKIKEELTQRDQLKEERAAQKALENFHKENPDFKQFQESGALDQLIRESAGFHDPVSAYWKMKHDKAFTEASELKRRLEIATGERHTGTVITSTGQEINVNPTEKLGPERLNPQKVDAGMRAVLRGLKT